MSHAVMQIYRDYIARMFRFHEMRVSRQNFQSYRCLRVSALVRHLVSLLVGSKMASDYRFLSRFDVNKVNTDIRSAHNPRLRFTRCNTLTTPL